MNPPFFVLLVHFFYKKIKYIINGIGCTFTKSLKNDKIKSIHMTGSKVFVWNFTYMRCWIKQ